MTDPIFDQWQPQHARLWGKSPLVQKHNLHKSSLFTDEALAKLIEATPRKDYSLVIPGRQDQGQHHKWREGDMGDATGKEVLDAIKEGLLWINLRNLPNNDRRFKRLKGQLFAEIEENVPGLAIRQSEITLLITSPGAQTYYHCDVPAQSLWHIRGRKKAWFYPVSDPFLPDQLLENVVMQIQEEDIPFEQWFDDHAMALELEPGMMVHWPQFAPHRVENEDCLNVSISTEYWSRDIERAYKVRYANGLLRQRFHMTPKRTDSAGMSYLAKAMLQSFWRRSGLGTPHVWDRKIDFKLVPSTPEKIRDIQPFHLRPSNQ